MKREYHSWWSPRLNRDMELLVFGHAGARAIVFPTSQGRYYEFEDRKMVDALHQHVEEGWLQIFCVDSVDAESFYCKWAHPSGRITRHLQYEDYVINEVLPLTRQMNDNPFLGLGHRFGQFQGKSAQRLTGYSWGRLSRPGVWPKR